MPTPSVSPATYASRLMVLQSMQELVWGTVPVSGLATARWMGVSAYPQFKPLVKSTLYDEDRGSLAWSFNSHVLELGGNYTVNWQYASYEDINFALMNVLQSVTPSGGGPFTYTYLGPLTAINPLVSYSLEFGYDIMTGLYSGCIGQKLVIKGESAKQWELQLDGFYKTYTPNLTVAIASSTSATPIVVTTSTPHGYLPGQQVVIVGHLVNTAANGTWTLSAAAGSTLTLTGSIGNGVGAATGTVAKIQTPAIADRTVEAILFPGTTLAIEAAGGTPGTTPFPGALLGFQLDIENNVLPIWTGDSKNPFTYAYDRMKVSLMLRLLENAQVKAQVENSMTAGTRQVCQVKQVSAAKSVELDFAGVLADNPTRYTSKNGAIVLEVKLEGQLDSGALANQLKSIVINSVSALP